MRDFEKLFGRKIFRADFSEIESMDNLQNPKEGILRSLQKASDIYGSKATFYLVNGSSSGIIALILSTMKLREKILIARNTHKSVINALIISGAEPVWLETEWDNYWNIPAVINPGHVAEKLDKNPDVKALLITNPTYEGIVTDIKPIAKICRERGIIFLVDEAHGALWKFSELLPDSSIDLGADACVQSLHKTGSCLNQGAVLHISEDSRINPRDVQQALNLINTTSPSYILLSSIEASIEYLNSKRGKKKLQRLTDNIEKTKIFLKENTRAVFLETSQNYRHDLTKIFFGLKGIRGEILSDYLQKKCNIEVELNNNKGILALTGIGTEKKHLKKLVKAIIEADKKLEKTHKQEDFIPFVLPKTAITPSEAFYGEFKTVDLKNAVGLISKETIVKYPPGIPVIIAGEVIQKEHLSLLGEKQEIKVIKN